MEQLISTIKTTLTSLDNTARYQAEEKIKHFRDTNPTEFFMNCAHIVQDQDGKYDVPTRQSTGTIASRYIRQKSHNGKYFWDQIKEKEKNVIKNKVLEVLWNPCAQIMKSGARILAFIASIDLPIGKWPELMDILGESYTKDQLRIKIASITTIGYICQQISTVGQRVGFRMAQQMLALIIRGIYHQLPTINQISLKALEESLSFLRLIMSRQKNRETVFQALSKKFKENAEVELAYFALFQFIKVNCRNLQPYRKTLVYLAQEHLGRRDYSAILNLEMWQSIVSAHGDKVGMSEIIQQGNFLQLVYEEVLPLIMNCLLIENPQEEKDDNIKLSAAKVLESFVKVGGKRVVDIITEAVNTTINSEYSYHQQATVLFFSTICEYSNKQLIIDLFDKGSQRLLLLLNNQNYLVLKNSLIGFIRVSEALPQVFLKHCRIEQIIQGFYNFVNVGEKDTRYFSIQILNNICKGLKENPQLVSEEPKLLIKFVKFYSQNMLKFHTEQPQVNQELTVMIADIVRNTNKRDVIVQLIYFMIEEYYKVTGINSYPEFLIEQILFVLHTSILEHKNSVPNHDLLERILKLVNQHIQKYGIGAIVLDILGATATTFRNAFESHVAGYWPLILQALDNANELTTFQATLSCICNFAKIMEPGFFKHADQVMTKLLDYMKANTNRQLKLSIINCMGDLVLSMQQYNESFFNQILKITEICFQTVQELINNQKDSEQVNQLKSNLIKMYNGMLGAMNESKSFDSIGKLGELITRTCNQLKKLSNEAMNRSSTFVRDKDCITGKFKNDKELEGTFYTYFSLPLRPFLIQKLLKDPLFDLDLLQKIVKQKLFFYQTFNHHYRQTLSYKVFCSRRLRMINAMKE